MYRVITSIEQYNHHRSKIFIDHKLSFVLYRNDIRTYQLTEGQELSIDVYNQILTKTLLPRCKKKALYLLESMDRSEYNLRTKLKEGFYPSEVIESTITYVTSFRYIDDYNYARKVIESKMSSKSKKEIIYLLQNKGVDKQTIEKAIELFYEDEKALDTIQKLIRKRRYDSRQASKEETQKMYSYLCRKGFSYEDVNKALALDEELV